MEVWLDLPDDVAALMIEKGQDIPRAALEALAVDALSNEPHRNISSDSCWRFPRATSSTAS